MSNSDVSVRGDDVVIKCNGSNDLLMIFGSHWGDFDFPGIMDNASNVDVVSFRDKTNSWYTDAGSSFNNLAEIEEFVQSFASRYSGERIFLGISMGGSAAIYFGSKIANARIIVGSPQLFMFQFGWSTSHRDRYPMIDGIPNSLGKRLYKSLDVFVCEKDDEKYRWYDSTACFVLSRLAPVNLHVLPCAEHMVWHHMSMRKQVEMILNRILF